MAEKIVKPEKFTKEWFSYIWCYYKVHILVVLAVIVLAAFTVYDYMSIVKYDLNMSVISKYDYSQDVQENLPLKVSEIVGDVNKNGSTDVLVTQLSFSDDIMRDLTQLSAADDKLLTLLVSEDEMLFVCDEYMMMRILDKELTEGAFIPVSEWSDEKTEKELGVNYGGGVYAASLKESKCLKEINIDTEDLYIMVKMNLVPEDEEITEKFNKSKELAKYLIKN